MGSRPVKLLVHVLALSILVTVAGACVGYGNVGTVTKTVDLQGAQRVAASFTISDGEIDVGGGADPLMHAQFTTNEKRKPNVDYRVQHGVGQLNITQSSKSVGFSVGPITNKWAVNLNDDVPLTLTVTNKSAQANLSLDTLTTESVSVNSDSGDAKIGLSGAQNQLQTVSLRSSSGSIHLLMQGDYQTAPTLHIDSSSGTVTADLSGKWEQHLTGTIKTDSGSITITVPKNASVKIKASTDSGYIDGAGFSNPGQGVYVHDGSNAAPTISLDVQSSNGNITLRSGS